MNLLKLLSLYDAIPSNWKQRLKSDKDFNLILFERNLKFTNNKDIYWAFIDLKIKSKDTIDAMSHYWSKRYNIDTHILKKYYYVPYTC